MDTNNIKFAKERNIGTIILNRPNQMNALNLDTVKELSDLLDEIARDDEIRVVILAGHQRFFCVGADITEVSKIDSTLKVHSFFSNIRSVFDKIGDFEKPVISAVSGFALGGGCELALACDLRIAAENAKFGLPEIKLGIIPGGGGTQRLSRIIGMTKAKELLFTGDFIDAQEAFSIGLVNKVVSVKSLMDETKKMASKIGAKPLLALKMAKHVVNSGINIDIKSAIAYEARCLEILFSTRDMREGINAFIEKRQPDFIGE
jgi:enoyl-CoA hydratase